MKKIYALVLAVAMIAVFVAVPAFAADTLVFKLDSNEINVGDDGSAVTLNFSIDTTAGAGSTAFGSIQFYLDVPKGVSFVSATQAADNTYKWTSQTTGTMVGYTDDSGVGADFIANPEYSKFVLTFKVEDTSKAAEYDIKIKTDPAATALDYLDYNDAATGYVNGKITVKDSAPAVKTITKTGADVLINNAKDKSETETTAEQIGGAAGFAFTIPAGVTLDDNMIWSLTTSEGKKFSQKVNAGLSALSGDVKVAATFVTGSHLAGEGRTPFNFEITAANGIFKAGEDFYFTDAADAALKAE